MSDRHFRTNRQLPRGIWPMAPRRISTRWFRIGPVHPPDLTSAFVPAAVEDVGFLCDPVEGRTPSARPAHRPRDRNLSAPRRPMSRSRVELRAHEAERAVRGREAKVVPSARVSASTRPSVVWFALVRRWSLQRGREKDSSAGSRHAVRRDRRSRWAQPGGTFRRTASGGGRAGAPRHRRHSPHHQRPSRLRRSAFSRDRQHRGPSRKRIATASTRRDCLFHGIVFRLPFARALSLRGSPTAGEDERPDHDQKAAPIQTRPQSFARNPLRSVRADRSGRGET